LRKIIFAVIAIGRDVIRSDSGATEVLILIEEVRGSDI
jgi:hypothetical protein